MFTCSKKQLLQALKITASPIVAEDYAHLSVSVSFNENGSLTVRRGDEQIRCEVTIPRPQKKNDDGFSDQMSLLTGEMTEQMDVLLTPVLPEDNYGLALPFEDGFTAYFDAPFLQKVAQSYFGENIVVEGDPKGGYRVRGETAESVCALYPPPTGIVEKPVKEPAAGAASGVLVGEAFKRALRVPKGDVKAGLDRILIGMTDDETAFVARSDGDGLAFHKLGGDSPMYWEGQQIRYYYRGSVANIISTVGEDDVLIWDVNSKGRLRLQADYENGGKLVLESDPEPTPEGFLPVSDLTSASWDPLITIDGASLADVMPAVVNMASYTPKMSDKTEGGQMALISVSEETGEASISAGGWMYDRAVGTVNLIHPPKKETFQKHGLACGSGAFMLNVPAFWLNCAAGAHAGHLTISMSDKSVGLFRLDAGPVFSVFAPQAISQVWGEE